MASRSATSIVPALGATEFDVSVTANAAAAVLRLLGSGRKLDAVEYQHDRQGVAVLGHAAQHSLRAEGHVQAALISRSYSAT